MNSLISYTLGFVSYIMENLDRDETKKIKKIILFGSLIRERIEKTSDIDIFVDVIRTDEKLEQKIQRLRESFFRSPRYKEYWKLLNIKNEFQIFVDKLDNYKLKESIISQGIILYGRYVDVPRGHKLKTLFFWKNVKPEIKRVNLFRKLFGYAYKGKRYSGLVQKRDGEHITKNCIVVESEFENEFLNIFRSMKIPVKIKKIIELG